MRTLALALAVFVFPVSSAIQEHEQPYTSGNSFFRLCSSFDKAGKSNEEIVQSYACVYYIRGVVDGIKEEWAFVSATTNKETPRPYCLPSKVEGGQAVRVTIEFLRSHPDIAHEGTSFIVARALREAFPCKE